VGSLLDHASRYVRDLIARPAGAAPRCGSRLISVWLVDHGGVATSRGGWRGSWQGAGRFTTQDAHQTPARRLREGGGGGHRGLGLTCAPGMVWWWRLVNLIPGDGEVNRRRSVGGRVGLTGESAPVIREVGRRSLVGHRGTKVLSDRIVIRIMSNPGETFSTGMIALVEGASRQKRPNESALHILLGRTDPGVLVRLRDTVRWRSTPCIRLSPTVIVALAVCLIPTTIGGLVSGHRHPRAWDRLIRKNVIAMSGRAIEAGRRRGRLAARQDRQPSPMGNRMARAFFAHAETFRQRLWRTRRNWPAWPTKRQRVDPSWVLGQAKEFPAVGDGALSELEGTLRSLLRPTRA